MDNTQTDSSRFSWARWVLLVAISAIAVACSSSGGASENDDASQADVEAPSEVTATTANPTSALLLAELQGLWVLTSAPGIEDALGSKIAIFDGPEPGDRYVQLSKDDSCINIHDYDLDGEILKTANYLGDVTGEECWDPVPEFSALFQDGSELNVAVDGNNLVIEAQGSTLGFDRS